MATDPTWAHGSVISRSRTFRTSRLVPSGVRVGLVRGARESSAAQDSSPGSYRPTHLRTHRSVLPRSAATFAGGSPASTLATACCLSSISPFGIAPPLVALGGEGRIAEQTRARGTMSCWKREVRAERCPAVYYGTMSCWPSSSLGLLGAPDPGRARVHPAHLGRGARLRTGGLHPADRARAVREDRRSLGGDGPGALLAGALA